MASVEQLYAQLVHRGVPSGVKSMRYCMHYVVMHCG